MKRITAFLLLTVAILSQKINAQVKTIFHENGNKMYEGQLLNAPESVFNSNFETLPKEEQMHLMAAAKKNGTWVRWDENGKKIAEEFYENGEIAGNWKSWNKNGVLETDLRFSNGISTFYFPTGEKQSEGKLLKGYIFDGEWVGYHENGKVNYKGQYLNGLKNGTWIYYDVNGNKTSEQVFENGNPLSHH